ncbi:MAG TPA: histidine kinase [Propionibacteriaceae bacterium]|nr:histidine kinase [Propionibacteriaceae bacterium]
MVNTWILRGRRTLQARRQAVLVGWAGLGRWPATFVDLLIATVVVTLTANDHAGWRPDLLVGLLMAAALLWRRSRPEAVFAVVAGLALIQVLATPSAPAAYDLAVLVAMVAVVSHAERLWSAYLAGLVMLVGVLLMGVRTGVLTFSPGRPTVTEAISSAAVLGLYAALWLTAFVLRTRRLLVTSLRERAATAERERDHLSRLAAADERAAVARELHDVVAHSLAVMILQADGASYAVTGDVDKARTAMQTIATTGREALADMHRIVDVLRGVGADPGVESGPGDEPGFDLGSGPAGDRRRVGLEQLGQLVDRAETAGLAVQLQMDDHPPVLTAAEDLTIVRLVQESLTNVLRHAGPQATVRVRLTFATAAVTVEVVDDGAGAGLGGGIGRRHGSGLIGMRERVSAHGGSFTAGPSADPGTGAGWTMRAIIPLRRPA